MAAPSTAGERAERIVRWAPPLIVLTFFSVTAAGYGVFRDELYYFACARHIDWGYVDHPPMIAVLAALVRAVFGDSWLAARWLSAVAAAGTVLLVGDTARELGGSRWARLLAQLLCATAPIYLALFSIFSMNAFDVLAWAALIRVAARLLAGGRARLWLVFGVIAGLGLLNKLDIGLLGAGLGIGLVLGWRVDLLRTRWIWIGGAIALVLFLPTSSGRRSTAGPHVSSWPTPSASRSRTSDHSASSRHSSATSGPSASRSRSSVSAGYSSRRARVRSVRSAGPSSACSSCLPGRSRSRTTSRRR